jgi:hypothetical protein
MTPVVAGEIDKAVADHFAPVDPGSEDTLVAAAAKNREARAFYSMDERNCVCC